MSKKIRRITVAASAGLALAWGAATSATALGAQTLCIGGPGSAVTVAETHGSCKKPNTTVKTLVERSELGDLSSQVVRLEQEVGILKSKVATLEGEAATLEGRIARLETNLSALQFKLTPVSYDPSGLNGLPTFKVEDANLQIVSGSAPRFNLVTGEITGAVNGLGNLFIGHNEQNNDTQTGSHNLIVGPSHTFTSYGGVLAGLGNRITAPWAFVSGQGNTVSGFTSSVTGGSRNLASGNAASVSGGSFNTADGATSSVSGGGRNRALGYGSSVSGGFANTTNANWSSILGARDITLNDEYQTSP